MSKLLPFFLAVLVAVFLVRSFEWPVPYHVVTDPLYGTMGINYLTLGLDFLVFFLMTFLAVGAAGLLLILLVVRSLFKEAAAPATSAPSPIPTFKEEVSEGGRV